MDDPVVVDSDVLIDYFAGIPPFTKAVQRVLQQDRLAVTTVTIFELACGAQTPAQLTDAKLLIQASHTLNLDAPADPRT